MVTAADFADSETINHTSAAHRMAGNVRVMRVGGGLGLPRTPITARSVS